MNNKELKTAIGTAMGYLAMAEGDIESAYTKMEEALAMVAAPPFADISDDLPHHATLVYDTRPPEDIEQIVIHHTAVSEMVGPHNTARYHIKPRDTAPNGWPGIGYHLYMMRDGTAYQTQPFSVVSYHCGGSCNTKGIGICLEGRFMDHEPPQPQLDATKEVLDWLMGEFHTQLPVFGHKEIRATACPGDTWDDWKGKIMP